MESWVVFASKYGSTRGVAEAIAERLARAHEGVELRDAADVESFEGADAVVLGSAIYGGRWLEPARNLFEERADELTSRPTWLFSVGPLGDPPKPEDAGPDGITEAMEATRARGHEVFAGKLERPALSRVERLMVRALRAPEGDFRDWDAIRSWADRVAADLS
ncbi:MAG: flavodoxin domain-containing protein [Thermoleophilaceae bacterium]|nr:flavodoxin domain-containing protein [Thermoleophilaceae bacterium]